MNRSNGVISRSTPLIPMSLPSGPRRTKRQAPPGRKSISQTASVQPCGPSQRTRCSGWVIASKTRRRGASKTRVMTISRSVGVVTVRAELVLALLAGMLLLLLFQFLLFQLVQIVVQTIEALLPETAVVLD